MSHHENNLHGAGIDTIVSLTEVNVCNCIKSYAIVASAQGNMSDTRVHVLCRVLLMRSYKRSAATYLLIQPGVTDTEPYTCPGMPRQHCLYYWIYGFTGSYSSQCMSHLAAHFIEHRTNTSIAIQVLTIKRETCVHISSHIYHRVCDIQLCMLHRQHLY